MFFIDNPVLQRELVGNLRTFRAFALMLVYQIALAAVVLIAYPREERMDLSENTATARTLVDVFFLGQFVLVSLIAPSFAAGTISGEKERKTYEMLLASPLRPGAIVIGKLVASLTHLLVLIFCSLPIVMLCLPLGGVSIYELLAAFVALLFAILLFGSIAVFCSCRFKRTSASLVVSYLVILPMVILGGAFWLGAAEEGRFRLIAIVFALPVFSILASGILLKMTADRLLYPPDIGSQGNEVIDLEQEQTQVVGLVIQRDQFPDRLFAPPRRKTLMNDNANPVYDKEIHAELFSQGTLMLRLVIQISMILAVPLMAILLFIAPHLAGWYIAYVVVFNILVGPVFTAGSISSERERQTLELLLTTTLKPSQILMGKLIAGYRVSFVLTMFLMWPVLLAFVLNFQLFNAWQTVLTYVCIVIVASIINSVLALFCSTVFRRTAVSMMSTYTILIGLYFIPMAIYFLTLTFDPNPGNEQLVRWLGLASPFMAIVQTPMNIGSDLPIMELLKARTWDFTFIYFGVTIAATFGLFRLCRVFIDNHHRLSSRN